MQCEVVIDDRARTAFEKQAEDEVEAARLRREADLLEVAGHPGLVELLDIEDGPGTVRLRTVKVDGPSLAEAVAQPLEAEEAAGVVEALASTVADLHAMGLVHGAVAPEHVILDGDGRPVLCSLGYGGLAGERPSAVPLLAGRFSEPSADGDGRLDPALDVYGLGALLEMLAAGAEGRSRRSSVDALRRLAAEAMTPARSDRPTARHLGDAVHDAVHGARLPGRGTVNSAPRGAGARAADGGDQLEGWRRARLAGRGLEGPRRVVGRRWRAGRAVVGVLVVVALGGVGLATLVPRGGSGDPAAVGDPGPAVPMATPTTSSVPPVDSLAPAPPVTVRTGCPPVEGSLSADVDGDGCAEAVLFADGLVQVGGRRWAVGQPGDVAAVGDWSCGGGRSLAVLRPATGEVFAFDGWATAERETMAPLVAQIGGARTLRASDLDGDGCHELIVERATGTPAVLRPPRP